MFCMWIICYQHIKYTGVGTVRNYPQQHGAELCCPLLSLSQEWTSSTRTAQQPTPDRLCAARCLWSTINSSSPRRSEWKVNIQQGCSKWLINQFDHDMSRRLQTTNINSPKGTVLTVCVCRWFCHVDDDNYVILPSLLRLLSSYHHSQDVYLGRPSLDHPIEAAERVKSDGSVSLLLPSY